VYGGERLGGQTEVGEDGFDDGGLLDGGDDLHRPPSLREQTMTETAKTRLSRAAQSRRYADADLFIAAVSSQGVRPGSPRRRRGVALRKVPLFFLSASRPRSAADTIDIANWNIEWFGERAAP